MNFDQIVNGRRAINFFDPEKSIDETKTLSQPKWRKPFDDIVVRFDI